MAHTQSIDMRVTGTVIGKFKADHLIKIPKDMKINAVAVGKEFLIRQYSKDLFSQMVDVAVSFPEPITADKKKDNLVAHEQ